MKTLLIFILSLITCLALKNPLVAQLSSFVLPDGLTFESEEEAVSGSDMQRWRFGATPVRPGGSTDPADLDLALSFSRINSEDTVSHSVLYMHGKDGRVGVGASNKLYSAQLYVELPELYKPRLASVWAANLNYSPAARWGVFGSASGDGGTFRYGVYGEASGNNNALYGLYGKADGNGNYALFANGSIGYTGSLSEVSDRRFKRNIVPFTALSRILQLKPCSYEMCRDEFSRMNLAQGRRYGFIAQELQEVFPELVHNQINGFPYTEDDSLQVESVEYLSVEYIPLIAILTQAIQEQHATIEEKEKRIKELEHQQKENEERFALLENRMAQLEALSPAEHEENGGYETVAMSTEEKIDKIERQ